MAHLQPAYRLRVYAPYSTDATEQTVLVPPATALHAEPLQVASIRGVAGYRPYLYPPTGRRGGFDALTKRVDTGELTFAVFDVRLEGGTNAQRWFSAFVGDDGGRPAMLNCRVEADESLDGGATWDRFFTGRVEVCEFGEVLVGQLTARDESERLEELLFVGRPHANATYAVAPAVLPVQGPPEEGAPYREMAGTIVHQTDAEFFRIDLDASATKQAGNLISSGLDSLAVSTRNSGYSLDHGVVNGHVQTFAHRTFPGGVARLGRSPVRALVRWSGGSGEYAVQSIWSDRSSPTAYFRPYSLHLATLPPGSRGYAARPADDAAVFVTLVPDAPASKEAPHIIGPVDPLVLWQAVLAGEFSRLNDDGSIRRSFPADAAAFAALAAARSFLPTTAIPEKPMEAREFIERYILKPYHLGYRLSPSGEVVPFDCRRDSTLATAAVLGSAEAAPLTGGGFSWRQGRADAFSTITVEAWRDRVLPVGDLVEDGSRPILKAPAGTVESEPFTIIDADLSARSLDVSGAELEVDAPGWRSRELAAAGRQSTAGGVAASLFKAEEAIIAAALALTGQLRALLGAGGTTLSRSFLRSGAGDCYPGMWRRLTVAEAPNPATFARGGERLALCVDRVEEGPFVALTFVDAGASSVAVVPALSALAMGAATGIPTVTVARNAAGDRVLLQVALTEQSVAVSPTTGWLDGGVADADGVFTLPVAPVDMRLWVRGRSEPAGVDADFGLPSAWVAPTPAFIDTATIATPTGVAVSGIVKSAATVEWTVGDATAAIEILLALGSFSAGLFDAPGLVVATLPAGTTSYRLAGLDGPSVAHCVGVRHVDAESGRFSAVATDDFTTGLTDVQLARPAGLVIASPIG